MLRQGQSERRYGQQHAKPHHHAAHPCRARVGQKKGGGRQRRQQDKHQVAREPRLHQAGRCVGKGVLRHAHHGQARHQEHGIGNIGQRRGMAADGVRENQLVQQGGQYGCANGLQPNFAETRHFFAPQGVAANPVHKVSCPLCAVRRINTCSKLGFSISIASMRQPAACNCATASPSWR